MNEHSPVSDKLLPLLNDVCDGVLAETQIGELADVLDSDAVARKVFIDHILLQADIRFLGRSEKLCSVGLAGIRAILPPSPPTSPGFPAPPVLATTFPGTTGYFSSGWPVAYLVATVICGVGLLIGAFVHVSDPAQFARQSTPLPSPSSTTHYPLSTIHSTIGRITGMVDCQWSVVSGQWSESTSHQPLATGRLIHLGDKFALTSGLMEITYDTGARVILQGSVTYEVESAASGFLSIGKLTARVESTKYGVRSTERSSSANHPSSNPQSPIPNPSLAPSPYPLFTIKTPTAVVTDLGTEFGVEVDKTGATQSHVFRGLVRVQVVAPGGKADGEGRVLHENESARVEKNAGNQDSDNRLTMLATPAKRADFVHAIPEQTTKLLDLVDVVAGGDGFSGRRNRGIDPTNGQPTDAPLPTIYVSGDGQYHRVEAIPFVDGVFIPDGRAGRVQVDSAGHVFTGFPNTDNRTANYLWAGGVIPTDPPHAIPTELGGIDYASPGHGLLSLHANKGITFDLNAIRQANADYKLLRFRAVAGNTETVSSKGIPVLADIWVLIDGRVCVRRWQIDNSHGEFSISVPIEQNDRFLTLVATDGGNGIDYDWILFGDPRLELTPVKTGATHDSAEH